MKKETKKTLIFLILSLVSFGIVFAIALMVGQYNIRIDDFFKAIFTNDATYKIQRSIIINLRLPRAIVASLSGIALSVSGLLYQEIFQNKLTSPDLLGVSSGSAVGASFALVLGLSSVLVSLFSFIMGIITVLLTILLSKLFRNGKTMTLILAGIIVGGFMSALLSLIKYYADPTTILTSITYWLMGSFENSTMKIVYIMFPVVAASCSVLLTVSWRINIVALGEEEAQPKGINYKLYKYLIIGISTLLTAVSVSFNGTISWVGLVIPHIVRLITGRETQRSIPLCITFGGIFMVIVDILSRTFTISEIPVSAITGLLGTAVFVIILLIKRRDFNVH